MESKKKPVKKSTNDEVFSFSPRPESGQLQTHIRMLVIDAIMAGRLLPGEGLPSSRALARLLQVSRNTVALAYQALADDGYVESRSRIGFFVSHSVGEANRKNPHRTEPSLAKTTPALSVKKSWDESRQIDSNAAEFAMASFLRQRPSEQKNLSRPENYREYRYPFLYGDADLSFFPLSAWRDCMRRVSAKSTLPELIMDGKDSDSLILVDAIRRHILPGRGIFAHNDEILITLGAQNALFLAVSLLVSKGVRVAIENPGYPDLRNMLALRNAELRHMPVDAEGARFDSETLKGCACVFVTPGHQCPTGATLSKARRLQILERARAENFLIIEDDYDSETHSASYGSLKALDQSGRVVYAGSLSKVFFPGMRMGFLVASREFVLEARALRRLMFRHPPLDAQHLLALFLRLGHYATLERKLRIEYQKRHKVMRAALRKIKGLRVYPAGENCSFCWVMGPSGFDARQFAALSRCHGVLIDPGEMFFDETATQNSNEKRQWQRFFRLGFPAISCERIDSGLAVLETLFMEFCHRNKIKRANPN